MTLTIGVIQTGRTRADLVAAHGEYPEMFAALLGPLGDFAFETHAVVDGDALPAPDAVDGWLMTGSRHGVYDGLPWFEPLKDFLRGARAARRPIVGVCFGHQILAEAFGGRAEKFHGGWQVGAGPFAVRAAGWTAALPDTLTLHSVHQDQVTAIPQDATVWAASEGCAYAGLSYGDPAAPYAVSIQSHPEYGAPYIRALLEKLVGDGRIDAERGAAALASIGRPVDNALVGRLFADYLRGAAQARAAA